MTTTPDDPTTALPGRPPVVDLATWQAARDELLVREKAHTREGDAIAAARRRLPMVEFDGTVEVVGPDGPVPFLDLFQVREELVVYKHMWYDGAPHQGQCEGCTTTAWHLDDAVYLNARGVSFAVLTTGRPDEVASYVEFMGYTQPWYSRARRGGAGRRRHGAYHLLPARRRPCVPHLLHDRPWQRAGQRFPVPARHDALRPPRRVGGQPRGLAQGSSSRLPGRWSWGAHLLVLALGRGRERRLGPDQPPRATVDPPWRNPRGDTGPTGPPPLTRLDRRWHFRPLLDDDRRAAGTADAGAPGGREHRWPCGQFQGVGLVPGPGRDRESRPGPTRPGQPAGPHPPHRLAPQQGPDTRTRRTPVRGPETPVDCGQSVDVSGSRRNNAVHRNASPNNFDSGGSSRIRRSSTSVRSEKIQRSDSGV